MTFTLSEIATALGTEFQGDGTITLSGAAEPKDARADQLALAVDPKYADGIAGGQARAALLWEGADWQSLGLDGAICMARGKTAMPLLTRALDPGLGIAPGIHPSAVVDDSAEIGEGARIGPLAVIGADVKIGANAQVGSHASIGYGTVIGDELTLHPGARIAHQCRIGDRFTGQSNSVVGGDGFSFVTLDKESAVESLRGGMAEGETTASVEGSAHWARVHSLGGVEIGDDVELGASSTIDRGTIRATRIGRGTKIDCQVQVGHNAEVGEDVMMCGNVGVSGSAKIGNRVVLGGKVGVSDNIFIGDDVIAGGGTNIYTNVPAGRAVLGSPAVKIETEMAIRRELRRLPRLADTLRELQKTVTKLVDKG
ncbi:UDP-3-O-[3-hydroxymyristoyl] glucosamine N-acyltransferase [Aliiroseovarius halocynthiae]|uniref:UDP-3-O-(3-hydroxymyristoyl)glucosamine N-acyltransferase n=1 Tax=Aliiroseovarius halocynthiae TaxID=985055 RepID=A0A545SWE5_9RHOB|nr:UDP-3-O-(3-hydroxymyristoyl)glucosamine N-acyltransferase [Aliiroseovarius halocynthiae]TQV69274.1 UDP-3-O-(3-hydroxymyristoyl)glucosamine N-acyltransferase [Aliiroseovarius halocynthiae]SMR72047.1 UDP-3-O-[3-hydroxymyristoyl] glucosamine N-acyltransferase [Aliiroseovarius halocynthiae]